MQRNHDSSNRSAIEFGTSAFNYPVSLTFKPKCITVSTQTASSFDDLSHSIEDQIQRAWDAQDGDDVSQPPDELMSLQSMHVRSFLSRVGDYQTAGGKKLWTEFVRPSLMAYLKECVLGEHADDDGALIYLQKRAGVTVHPSTFQRNVRSR